MLKRTLFLVPLIFGMTSCGSLPYEDDIGFSVSAQANSMEFPIRLNGRVCADLDGQPGMCSKRLSSKEDLVVHFDPQDYPTNIRVRCTKGLEITPAVSVPAKQAYDWKIPATAIAAANLIEFTCIGEVLPQDRDPPISAKFKISVSIYDAAYKVREQAYLTTEKGKTYLVLGKYARRAWVYDQDKWAYHKEDTIVQVKGDPTKLIAYSESFAMRFNYWNWVR